MEPQNIESIVLLGDCGRISHVLLNIVHNSVKFANENSQVTIGIRVAQIDNQLVDSSKPVDFRSAEGVYANFVDTEKNNPTRRNYNVSSPPPAHTTETKPKLWQLNTSGSSLLTDSRQGSFSSDGLDAQTSNNLSREAKTADSPVSSPILHSSSPCTPHSPVDDIVPLRSASISSKVSGS